MRRGLWAQAELVVVMADLAEIVGGAVALNLLIGLPLLAGGLAMAAGLLVVLSLRVRGREGFGPVVVGLLAVVLLAFLYQTVRTGADGPALAAGLVPSFPDGGAVLLAAGIVGATVTPHAIYLHSALTQHLADGRGTAEQQRAVRATRWDIAVAMSLAGAVNIAIIVAAAPLLGASVDTLESAHEAFSARTGAVTGVVFALALLASGLASSCVGVYTGQVVMAGFTHRRIPLSLRRAVSMLPALVLLAVAVDPTTALVLSQVVLSFGIPFALVPLLLVTADRSVMGALVNRPATTAAAAVVAALIIGLNAHLLVLTAGGG